MSAYTAKDVVSVAEQWLGWHEEGNNGNPFDEQLAPYSEEIDFDAAWCDLFNDFCHFIASNYDAEHAQYVLCGRFDDYTIQSAQYYKDAGRWGQTPEYGAQVFFGNGGISHTGIVTWVDGDRFGTIEGNSGDAVRPHEYDVDDPYVQGFGYPRYDAAQQPTKRKKVRKMECLIRPNGANYMVYFDGVNPHPLHHPDEMAAIQACYKACTGEDMPCFEMGSEDAPWATRLFEGAGRPW